jgi:glutamyl-Q tRNA(Asp) synthetase
MVASHHPIPRPVLRFAPSPNGLLHLGHALSALENAALANRLGGRLLLRIEDIDATRCRSEFEAAILEDLEWLGIAYERPVRRQSQHMADYGAALDRLDAMGLVYPSFESRTELKAEVVSRAAAPGEPWPVDPDGAPLYPGSARALTASERATRIASGAPYALRLDMQAALARVGAPLSWVEVDPEGQMARTVPADPARWGDVILARKDIPTSYHLSVVVDDAVQAITHVVRGQDLFQATSVHRLLQELLGLPQPLYRHHRLLLGADGRKLSKSDGATGLRELREQGLTAADIHRRLSL